MKSLSDEFFLLRNAIHIYLTNRKKPLYLDYLKWKYSGEANKLKKFRNIHQGEDCFIIGNGPSLNKMDLEKLNDHYTFGLNKIYYIFDKVNLKLSYYVSVNQLVIEQSIGEFSKIPEPKFLALRHKLKIAQTINNCYPIYTEGGINGFQKDITRPIVEGGTVTTVALQIAYFMGFQRVFLIGVDHNFVAQGKANEEQTLTTSDINHFDPRYFANQKWNLPDLNASETSYMLAKYIFNSEGREIIDATVDGKLTVFPKMDYDEALKLCKKAKQK